MGVRSAWTFLGSKGSAEREFGRLAGREAAPPGTGATPAIFCPQLGQNFAPGGISAPQAGHKAVNAAPHDWQNRAPSGVAALHTGHWPARLTPDKASSVRTTTIALPMIGLGAWRPAAPRRGRPSTRRHYRSFRGGGQGTGLRGAGGFRFRAADRGVMMAYGRRPKADGTQGDRS